MISAPPCLHTTVQDVDLPGGLVGLLPHLRPSGTWIREREGLIGLGVAASTTAAGPGRFRDLADYWESVPHSPATPGSSGPVALVSITFSEDSEALSRLLIPEVLIRSEAGRTSVLITTAHPESPEQVLARHGLRINDRRLLQPTGASAGGDMPECRLQPGVQSERQYLSAIAAGLTAVHEGTVDKLVLARDLLLGTQSPLHTGSLLARLASEYPQTWTYCVGGTGGTAETVLGATPEMLVRLRGTRLSSRVLAGTIGRTQHTADLVRDAKQHREHGLAVTSLLEQLRPVTGTLQSPSKPSVLELPNVYHLASDISGELSADAAGRYPSPLQVAEAAHPTAAVCGTPTTTAAGLIAQLEGMDRGPYAGPVGWLDAAGNADFGIALRGGVVSENAEAGGGTVRIFAGCGVVAGSEPEAELAETRVKLKPMLWALGLEA
ncbi:isochorismate synthase [Nesterenkonia sphaerica]|uniref:isochorismate synthase n=1 Tax=Nesterenkonia sphaerica TaxID=1804988 RepID=A0A5R9APX1_9MICC|nr:isochorismate synthase [Nesterenkonia sphaerica]TLP80064.1 isochorismate synthase [Nesterenkonia sphaerica]